MLWMLKIVIGDGNSSIWDIFGFILFDCQINFNKGTLLCNYYSGYGKTCKCSPLLMFNNFCSNEIVNSAKKWISRRKVLNRCKTDLFILINYEPQCNVIMTMNNWFLNIKAKVSHLIHRVKLKNMFEVYLKIIFLDATASLVVSLSFRLSCSSRPSGLLSNVIK